ncbi:hypothetical protein AusDCA_1506 [Desulfitobacterium sp. AusDCA]
MRAFVAKDISTSIRIYDYLEGTMDAAQRSAFAQELE